nr:hypothetical protein [Tanacetum cinerariifolium]
ERSDSLDDNIISGLSPFSAITPDEPVLSTEEPDNSLSMGDEHLDTIPATKSDEVLKSGVENLIPIPNQFEDLSESNEDFSSTDDDSFSFDKINYVEASPPDSELVSSEVMEIVIPEVGGIEASNDNPILFYDPIIYGTPPNSTPSGEKVMEIVIPEVGGIEASNDNPILFYDPIIYGTPPNSTPSGESDFFLEVDSLLDEFAGELTLLKLIPSGIDEAGCDFKEDIRLIEKLLYDNSSPQFVYANSDAKSESFSPSPILVKDSDSLMEEIDLFCTPDYPMPPGIFWTTVVVKKVSDVTRLQALVDKKKVVVTEATIRDILRLDDAEGVECLPNEEIFAELARMGYEKPSTKLTFYKAFFQAIGSF